MTSIYLAGPVRHAPDGGAGWREELVAERSGPALEFYNPLSWYDASPSGLEIHKGQEFADRDGVVSVAELVGNDKQLLDAADALLVGYSDVQMIGTPMEVMWCHERGYPIALWIRDDTPFDELSPWFRHHATCVTNSREMAIGHLQREVAGDE